MYKIPLLTVSIPTYKRPRELENTIKILQKEKNQDFTLLISDDSADDETEKMVCKYAKSMKNLVYSKNKQNLGFSGNVLKLYETSKTRYVWFLCDDDTVIPGAIDKIIDAIKKYKFVIGIFNCTWYDVFGRKNVAGVKKDIVYSDIKSLSDYQPLMRTTFLSILVMQKVKSCESLKLTDYKNNIFPQLTLSLLLLSEKFRLCEIATTILHRNVGYKYGEFFKFNLIDHIKAAYVIDHKFDNKRFIEWSKKKNVLRSFQLYLSQKIGLFKYNGSPTKETKNLIRKYYGFYSVFIPLFVVIYYCAPTPLLKFLYFTMLSKIHGSKKASSIYKNNINRAFRDIRKTGFTTYR